MERPTLSLMGIQSGDNYLRNKLNEYSKYCDYLEDVIDNFKEYSQCLSQ